MASQAKADAMKATAMKGAAGMSKTAIVAELATATEVNGVQVKKVLDFLRAVATREVKKSGKFTIPGLVMIKTRMKPATQAVKKKVFGKTIMLKAKPATKIVKGFCVASLKKSI